MRLKAGTWEVDSSLRSPKDAFSESLGEPNYAFESRLIWENERLFGLYTYRTILSGDSGSFKLKTIIKGSPALYIIFLVFIFLIYDSIFSEDGALVIVFVTLFWTIIYYYLYSPKFKSELYNLASLKDRNVTPLLFIYLLCTLVFLWYRLRNLHPSYSVDAIAAICFCYLVIASYSLNLLPFVSRSTNNSVLFAPSLVLQRLVFSLGIFVAFGFFVGFYWFQTEVYLEQLATLEPTRENASIAADVMGGLRGAGVRREVLITAGWAFATAYLIGMIYLVLESIQARRVVQLQQASVAQPFSSDLQKNTLLTGFALSTLLIVLLFIPILSVLLYGVLGYLPFPGLDLYTGTYTAEPIELDASAVQLSQNMSGVNMTASNYTEAAETPILENLETEIVIGEPREVTTVELVEANYEASERLLMFLPGPSRLLSIIFFAGFIFPVVMFLFNWAVGVPSSFLTNLYTVRKSNDPKTDYSDRIEIPVRRVSDERGILVRPMSFFFGFKRYILISESVDDRLNEDELSAVLAHEVYHIENRDLQIGKVSKLLSFCFGGKNALLAFYDYPKIEQEADDYAARNHGARSFRIALDKIDTLRYELAGFEIKDTDDLSPDRFGVEEASFAQRIRGRAKNIGTKIDQHTGAPQKILYGDLLLERAHRSPEERMRRIRDNDYSGSQ